jgi:hypothetical protein
MKLEVLTKLEHIFLLNKLVLDCKGVGSGFP